MCDITSCITIWLLAKKFNLLFIDKPPKIDMIILLLLVRTESTKFPPSEKDGNNIIILINIIQSLDWTIAAELSRKLKVQYYQRSILYIEHTYLFTTVCEIRFSIFDA